MDRQTHRWADRQTGTNRTPDGEDNKGQHVMHPSGTLKALVSGKQLKERSDSNYCGENINNVLLQL